MKPLPKQRVKLLIDTLVVKQGAIGFLAEYHPKDKNLPFYVAFMPADIKEECRMEWEGYQPLKLWLGEGEVQLLPSRFKITYTLEVESDKYPIPEGFTIEDATLHMYYATTEIDGFQKLIDGPRLTIEDVTAEG